MRKLMIAALAAVTAIAASAAGNGQKANTATTRTDDTFFTSGGLFTGVNYWASHAGTYMWRRWDAKTVEKDFAALRAQGVDTLRVFPLWPDFQPLTRMIGNIAPLTEGVLQSDMPLSNPAGVDEEMMKRFRLMCDAAQRHNMKLVVGLITGWMSGRRFLPPALEDKNPICNPESIKWQVRFVRHFVREMRDHPAIAAWDLGNECNTFGGNRPNTNDHAFNGFGQINTGLAFAPSVSNLIALRLGGTTFPIPDMSVVKRMQLGVDFFVYSKMQQDAPIDEFTNDSQFLGWEPDLSMNWQITSDVTLAVRYGIFFPNSDAFQSDQQRQFIYAGITYAF
jgi:hypothetical protein